MKKIIKIIKIKKIIKIINKKIIKIKKNNNNNNNHTPVCAERQLMHVGYMGCLAVKAHPDNSVTAT